VPDIEFLADMNISPSTVKQLRKKGWDIVRISEILDRKSTDIKIINYAKEHNKVIITQDLDFSMLLAVRGYTKPSVINLRLENARSDFITKRIIAAVSLMEKELRDGIIVTVDETSVRYRNLPIKLA
jgi:predicted nuclease of predicted toxin-antitoxin system